MVRRKKLANQADITAAEKEIRSYARTIKFTVTEYTFEFIVDKLNKERYYVPDYQRNLIWQEKQKSKFIESVFMGLPIPFVFFWQALDGRMEIVDGAQRLRTIQEFMEDKFTLKDLEILPKANGLKFSDFSQPLRYRIAETGIRCIVLDQSTDAVMRTEMFARINTGGTLANEAEVRRGVLQGPFMDLVIKLSESEEFIKLTPISKKQVRAREREELVTRFFAYLEGFESTLKNGEGDIPSYKESPKKFYFDFVKTMNEKISAEEENGISETSEKLKAEFKHMLAFVTKVSPNGFNKTATGKQVPRVRFEAIAVGSALALRDKESLFNRSPNITPLLEADNFEKAVRSDAANVKSKLLNRINLVRNWLLER